MSEPLRVLFLEDEPDDVTLLALELRRAGFAPAGERVETEEEFLARLDPPPDVILSDFTVPGFSGLEGLRLVRERGLDVPFLFVSGTIGEDVAVTAMQQGAADYLLKDRLARLGPAVRQALDRRRLQQEKQLAEQATARLAAIVESSSDAIIATTLDGAIVSWNPAAERLYGYPAAEVLGQDVSLLVPSGRRRSDAPEDHRDMAQKLRNGESIEAYETVRVRKDGRRVDVLVSVSPIRDSAGAVLGASVIAHDIGQRKRAERFLAAQHAVTRILAGSGTLEEASPRLLRTLAECLRWEVAVLWKVDHRAGVLRRVHTWHSPWAEQAFLQPLRGHATLGPGTGVAGRAWSSGEPVWESGPSAAGDAPGVTREGLRGAFGLPMRLGNRMVGVIEFYNPELCQPDGPLLAALDNIASQISQFSERRQGEAALRESEERFRQLADAMPQIVWTARADGHPEYYNERWYEVTGLPRGRAGDRGWLSVLHPEDVQRFLDAWSASVHSGEPFEIECRIKDRRTGRYRWHLGRALPGKDRAGHTVRWFGTCTDIDDQKQAAEALRASEGRFRALIEKSFDGIALLDRDGVFTYASPSAGRILGYPPEDLVGRHVFEFVHPDDRQEHAERHIRVVREAGLCLLSCNRYRHRDGSWRWLEVQSTNLFAEPGVRAKVVNFRDVTQERQAEEENRQHRELLQKVFDHIPVMVSVFDAAGRLQTANRHWEEVLGWSLEEARRGDILAECYPDPTYRRQVFDYIRAAPPGWSDFRTRARDGRYLETRWANVSLSDGTTIGFGQDVTERKQLEEQYRQSQKMEAFGQLAGGVAHDFNNLLTVICGFSDLVVNDLPADAPTRKMAEEVRKAGERGAALTRQLLAFSRKQVLAPAVLDLNTVLHDLEKLLRRTIGEDIDLATELEPDLGHVKADPGQLEQILLNLAVNARDAMPEGGKLTIETQNALTEEGTPDLPAGRYVVLAVTDTGCGMTEEVRRQCFEPFFTTKGVGRGTGLGLATVYGIVRQSGGQISVYSEQGVGTSFKVYLPRVDAPVNTSRSQHERSLAPRGSETVLLVEDDDALLGLTRRILQDAGYTVLTAGSGTEAVRVCEAYKDPIDLLLTDVVMPELGGRRLAEWFRGRHPGAKVLFVSGYTDDAVVRHGILDAQVNFLQKPFSPLALAHKVREVLGVPTPSGPGEDDSPPRPG